MKSRRIRPRARPVLTPSTPEEWQAAVDAAHGALALDSARQYGLVEGGPTVDVDRAAEMLEEGQKRGIRPSPDAIERFVAELLAEAELHRGNCAVCGHEVAIRRNGTAWEHPGSRKRKGQPVCPGAGKPIANASPAAAR